MGLCGLWAIRFASQKQFVAHKKRGNAGHMRPPLSNDLHTWFVVALGVFTEDGVGVANCGSPCPWYRRGLMCLISPPPSSSAFLGCRLLRKGRRWRFG